MKLFSRIQPRFNMEIRLLIIKCNVNALGKQNDFLSSHGLKRLGFLLKPVQAYPIILRQCLPRPTDTVQGYLTPYRHAIVMQMTGAKIECNLHLRCIYQPFSAFVKTICGQFWLPEGGIISQLCGRSRKFCVENIQTVIGFCDCSIYILSEEGTVSVSLCEQYPPCPTYIRPNMSAPNMS